MSDMREESRSLLRSQDYLLNGTVVATCQRKCLDFLKGEQITDSEKACLKKCADQYTFLDLATFELDSAAAKAQEQQKAKGGGRGEG